MFRLFSQYRLTPIVNQCKMMSQCHLICTVDALKKQVMTNLEEYDTAQACESSYQTCKLSMKTYVDKLELKTNITIVPKSLTDPWDYNRFSKLCLLIQKTLDTETSMYLGLGWDIAFKFHVLGWTQNDLTIEDVEFDIQYVYRFIQMFETELKVDHQMAIYLKDRLFTLDSAKLTSDTHQGSTTGKGRLTLQNFQMSKGRVCRH